MYANTTYISGKKGTENKCYALRGHWNLDSAITYARQRGMDGELRIEHSVFDMSGKGRGGHDGKWIVAADNTTTKTENWREGKNINQAAALLGSITSAKKAKSSAENGKKGGRPRGINLATLIDRYGANGVIRIDAGNGSAGPAWVEWGNDIKKEIGKIKMFPINKNLNVYAGGGDDNHSQSALNVAKHVIRDYSCDNNTMYASAWIEDDDRNAPYQSTNPYRYRLIF